MKIKVALLGVGRMGQAAGRTLQEEDGIDVVAALDIDRIGDKIFGVTVSDTSDLEDVLERTRPDVVVDFTSASACAENSRIIGRMGINMVVGPTGFTKQQLKALRENLGDVGVVQSPNMSVGVNIFWQLVGEAAAKLEGYDIEVVEAHHRFKKDAPSGTALKAVDEIKKATGRKNVIFGRHGESLREDGEICVHSIRGGDIAGEHSVIFSTIGERFEVRHQAHSRESFATGLAAAVRFIAGKKGFHDMNDVLGL